MARTPLFYVTILATLCIKGLRFYVSFDTKYSISETISPANLLASVEEKEKVAA